MFDCKTDRSVGHNNQCQGIVGPKDRVSHTYCAPQCPSLGNGEGEQESRPQRKDGGTLYGASLARNSSLPHNLLVCLPAARDCPCPQCAIPNPWSLILWAFGSWGL